MDFKFKGITATAPVRVCDVGGWTDTWFSKYGAVSNIAVSPQVEVKILPGTERQGGQISLNLINYNQQYNLNPGDISPDRHPIVEAIIAEKKFPDNLYMNISIYSQIPPGASTGTSAAVAVTLMGALNVVLGETVSPYEVAMDAHSVETLKLGLQSGIQDQLASAFGGINYIDMDSFPRAVVKPIAIARSTLKHLEQRMVLVYAGSPHNSNQIHEKVIADLGADAHEDKRLNRLRKRRQHQQSHPNQRPSRRRSPRPR